MYLKVMIWFLEKRLRHFSWIIMPDLAGDIASLLHTIILLLSLDVKTVFVVIITTGTKISADFI